VEEEVNGMGILTDEMKRVVREQRLGYIATVCPDGTPNLSPKGTTTIWDDDHLVFAHIYSPNTIANLKQNPALEINVVDPFLRKGFRFKGTAVVLEEGPEYQQGLEFFRTMGVVTERDSQRRVLAVVIMKVERALPLISPAYDTGRGEKEVRAEWERYWEDMRGQSDREQSDREQSDREQSDREQSDDAGTTAIPRE
jgi:hypothetical protein